MAVEKAEAQLAKLENDCNASAARLRRKGRAYYWGSYCVMILSLAGSIGAGLLALVSEQASRALVGEIALIPAFCAMVAGQLRLVEKSNWFYRHQRELNALARRVGVARLRAPTIETLEACYEELTKIDMAQGAAWANDLTFDFAAQGRRDQA